MLFIRITVFVSVCSFCLTSPVSAQLISPHDEWFGVIDSRTAERGITIATPSRNALMGIRAGLLPDETRALLRTSASREKAASFLSPRDGMRYVSDLFYYQFYDVLSLQGEGVLALESEPLAHRGGVYLFDLSQNRWFPLKTIDRARGKLRAVTDSLSGYIAVLEYENDDAELLSLISSSRAVAAANGDNHLFVAHHSRDRMPIASLTKLMTALVFLEHNPAWGARITINGADDAPPAKLAFQSGDVVTVRALFDAMLVGSKNNAAHALARASGLPPAVFIRKMNEKAVTLGMEDTYFVDVTGLSPQNVGTARDMALLARAALTNGEIRSAVGKRIVSVDLLNRKHTLHVPTTNDLVAAGLKTLGKTGTLPEVGHNLVLIKHQNDGTIVFVILGAPSSDERFALGRRLLERPW